MLPKRLDTSRLVLQAWCEADAEELRRTLDHSDAHLRPWIPFMQQEPRSLAATRTWIGEIVQSFARGEHFRYAIRRRARDASADNSADNSAGELLGETMLLQRGGPDTREIGYWLHADHCGHGYATEASRPLIRLAFDKLLTRRIVLRCDERNLASLAVARRLGAVAIGEELLEEQGQRVRRIVFERPWDARDEVDSP